MGSLKARNGKQAIFATLIVSAILVAAVYLASLPVTEPDGSVDPEESVIEPG
ncbi:hypothetical protein MRS76_20455 [Rhizobiaceae bacterium n13]|uniref:hypothetical protein n=1 Tax=Ferirhizobium litorale TaxID=2927786 RepID=UPI0024B28ACA|nr:hypothetical protein [Fererhizobium litorale]MDI7864314.1 hypothetical protein [Fererhizobium litorale]